MAEGSLSRFSVLPDDRRLILGLDRDGVFEQGVVYTALKIGDDIILRPIGEYALPSNGVGGFPNANSDANAIVHGGYHLVTNIELDLMISKY